MDTDAYDFAPAALGSAPPITDDVKAAIRRMEIERVTADLRAQGLFERESGPTLLELKEAQYRRDMEPAALADGLAFIAAWNERAVLGRTVSKPKIASGYGVEPQPMLVGA